MDSLQALQTSLGFRFHDPKLLQQSLVHRSYLNESFDLPADASNERLEFLGDAVLGLIIAQELYTRFPDQPEGVLTRMRAHLVGGATLGRVGERLGLGSFLVLGRGEEQAGGRARRLNLARALEAVLGAVYLDQGLDVTRVLVLRILDDQLAALEKEDVGLDPKSALQHVAQGVLRVTPEYVTVGAEGPDHAPEFVVEVRLGGAVGGIGKGASKRLAQQEAAANALANLRTNMGRSQSGAPQPNGGGRC